MPAGKSALVSVKYHSQFRDLTAQLMEGFAAPRVLREGEVPKGMVTRNRKLEERLEAKKKAQQEAQ